MMQAIIKGTCGFHFKYDEEGADVNTHTNRLGTQMDNTNKLQGSPDELLDDDRKDLLFHSFKVDWQDNCQKDRGAGHLALLWEEICKYMVTMLHKKDKEKKEEEATATATVVVPLVDKELIIIIITTVAKTEMETDMEMEINMEIDTIKTVVAVAVVKADAMVEAVVVVVVAEVAITTTTTTITTTTTP